LESERRYDRELSVHHQNSGLAAQPLKSANS
jgi:hypothetical protein